MSDEILTDEQIGFCYDLGKMWKIKASHIAALAEITRLREENKTIMQNSQFKALTRVCEENDRLRDELAEKERVIEAQSYMSDYVFHWNSCDGESNCTCGLLDVERKIAALASGGEQGQGERVAGQRGESNETGSGASDSGVTSKPPAAPSPASPVCRWTPAATVRAAGDFRPKGHGWDQGCGGWTLHLKGRHCPDCGLPIVTDREEEME